MAAPPRPPPPAPADRGSAFAGSPSRNTCCAAALAAALLAAGCGRTMTEEDCRRIGETMQAAWLAEVKKAAPPESPTSAKAAGVLKSEEERLVSEWTAECKKELQGRRIDAKEMSCLLAAKTLEQLTKCAER
jgi:hypothetical protein